MICIQNPKSKRSPLRPQRGGSRREAYLRSRTPRLRIGVQKGFTLVELLIVIGILIILTAVAVPSLRYFQKGSDLNNSAEEIINILRLAQNKTLVSERASQYGVYFDNLSIPHQYILFKGPSFDLRDDSFDEIHELSKSVEIYEINLLDEALDETNEIVFERLTGETSQSGNVSLILTTNLGKTKTIYIESSGLVSFTVPSTPTGGRVTDSRHVHFDYSRVIDTVAESLTLSFEGGMVTETIVIADNIKDGQIYWEGEVNVGGEIQEIKIHTHRLNNPDTQFCIHRDRRDNNKSLTITISGDGTGSLISYTAEGQESRGTSIYLAPGETGDPQCQ